MALRLTVMLDRNKYLLDMIGDCTIDDARIMAPHTNCRQVVGGFLQMERKSESGGTEIEDDIKGGY
jgi:hypothetical protein